MVNAELQISRNVKPIDTQSSKVIWVPFKDVAYDPFAEVHYQGNMQTS